MSSRATQPLDRNSWLSTVCVSECQFFFLGKFYDMANYSSLPYPIGSMYAIYGNIYHPYTPNVSIYSIHGSYGYQFTLEALVATWIEHVEHRSWLQQDNWWCPPVQVPWVESPRQSQTSYKQVRVACRNRASSSCKSWNLCHLCHWLVTSPSTVGGHCFREMINGFFGSQMSPLIISDPTCFSFSWGEATIVTPKKMPKSLSRIVYWFVVSNMFYFFHNISDNPSHWRTHIFQDGYNHQPDWINHVSLLQIGYQSLSRIA